MGGGADLVGDQTSMNLTDDITEVIRTAPISNIDLTFARAINPAKAYEALETKPEYRTLIDTMMQLYSKGLALGVPAERAGAAVLGTFEEIIRYVVTKAVKDRLHSLGVSELQGLDEARELGVLGKKIEDERGHLKAIEDEHTKHVRAMKVDQFKASLLYAGERWGKPAEQRAIKAMVARMPETDAEVKKDAAH